MSLAQILRSNFANLPELHESIISQEKHVLFILESLNVNCHTGAIRENTTYFWSAAK